MKMESPELEYGVYIDHKKAYIVTLTHGVHEEFLDEVAEIKEAKIPGADDHIQKFYKAVVARIVHPSRILIFGPAEAKHELRKEIDATKSLKHVREEFEKTDAMDKDQAVKFTTHFFHTKL